MTAGNHRNRLHILIVPYRFHAHIGSAPFCTDQFQRLIGKSRETALANLKQQLESALLQDDRILSITDLNVTDSGRRFLTVSFTANTIFGAVGEEITANV